MFGGGDLDRLDPRKPRVEPVSRVELVETSRSRCSGGGDLDRLDPRKLRVELVETSCP